MRPVLALVCAVGLALLGPAPAEAAPAADTPRAETPQAARIEARSPRLLAIGVVHGDRLTIHVSRLQDNAPIHDAVLTVRLRGTLHPTVAETDGSYTLQTPDLSLPGAAAVEFQVVQGPLREDLEGTLAAVGPIPAEPEKNSTRQLAWWVLNFSVCLGFLWLWSRRRKSAPQD